MDEYTLAQPALLRAVELGLERAVTMFPIEIADAQQITRRYLGALPTDFAFDDEPYLMVQSVAKEAS